MYFRPERFLLSIRQQEDHLNRMMQLFINHCLLHSFALFHVLPIGGRFKFEVSFIDILSVKIPENLQICNLSTRHVKQYNLQHSKVSFMI